MVFIPSCCLPCPWAWSSEGTLGTTREQGHCQIMGNFSRIPLRPPVAQEAAFTLSLYSGSHRDRLTAAPRPLPPLWPAPSCSRGLRKALGLVCPVLTLCSATPESSCPKQPFPPLCMKCLTCRVAFRPLHVLCGQPPVAGCHVQLRTLDPSIVHVKGTRIMTFWPHLSPSLPPMLLGSMVCSRFCFWFLPCVGFLAHMGGYRSLEAQGPPGARGLPR